MGKSAQNWIGHNFWLDGPIDLRTMRLNFFLQDLIRDTPLDHIWSGKICAQICIFGLRDAVAPLLGKHLKVKNILQISTMAEKHSAIKLQEQCCRFILDNIDAMTSTVAWGPGQGLDRVPIWLEAASGLGNQTSQSPTHGWKGFPSQAQGSGQQDFRPQHFELLQEKGGILKWSGVWELCKGKYQA